MKIPGQVKESANNLKNALCEQSLFSTDSTTAWNNVVHAAQLGEGFLEARAAYRSKRPG